MASRAGQGAALASTTPPTTPPPAPPTTATGVPDPLGCDALVYDPSGELDAGVVAAEATATADLLGADVHVRAERDLDGGLAARMTQLEAQCPGWWTGVDRADDLVVVLYSSTEREASVFYGPHQADRLEFRWEHAVDEMGPRFAAGDYTGGVVAGLGALREDAPVTYTPTFSPTHYEDDDAGSTSSGGVPPILWLFLLVVVLVAATRVAQYMKTGAWDTGGDDDSGSSWSSSSRRRSSSSSSRRSFGSSRSSSSARRSSGRSGGGTKKW